ncbi:hypothetical protein [Rhodohalobacter sp. SW132]|uniref:hypothetical protein n=1 Tax=Rhodohalobacter sp. SW132 TaxID=2293433 RepID=UPI001314446D|nr:hypothetical protein [Rhodohalobacter sp. SW132]
MNRASSDQHKHDPQQKAQKPNLSKRPWTKPKVMEEDFRNTEQQPGLPYSPQQVS